MAGHRNDGQRHDLCAEAAIQGGDGAKEVPEGDMFGGLLKFSDVEGGYKRQEWFKTCNMVEYCRSRDGE